MAVQQDAWNNIVLGDVATVAASAQNGFVYFPAVSGQPTGTPQVLYGGMVPAMFDTVGNEMYYYGSNSSWAAAGAGTGLFYYNAGQNQSWAGSVIGIGTLDVSAMYLPSALVVSAADIFVSNTLSATNAGSSWGITHSATLGAYTKSGSSLSLASSGSVSYAYTITGSSSSASYQGLKALSIPFAATFTKGNYWLGYIYSTASAGNAIGAAMSNVVMSYAGGMSAYLGRYGANTGASNAPIIGQGAMSVSTAALPAVIALSDMITAGNTGNPVIALRNIAIP